MKYNYGKIEKKWQKKWEEREQFSRAEDFSDKPKYYVLIEFPYPSGEGLHLGHPRSYVALDIIARKRRMEGFNVLYPIGWDAFGLPAENYALKTGQHPRVTTEKNIANFRRQLKALGLSFDWSREVNTTDPAYYRWTQWMFLQFFKHDLAYKVKVPINWCPSCKIGLANEEVVGGACERCGGPVEKRDKEQWMLKITKYADRLVDDLKGVDYLSKIKKQQEDWIGRKEGINIVYAIEGNDETIEVFTTRPDTNFGATFAVLAPEHKLALKIATAEYKDEVVKYIENAKKKTDAERLAEGRKKTGVFTGSFAINHLTGRRMPVWISDFVLVSFGTGAVVGVPGHDLRDFEFAQEFGIEVVRVVVGPDGDTSPIVRSEQVQEESGLMVNSDFLDGLDIHDATRRIMDYMEEKGWGKRVVQYKLRDWIFSRQRYWGEPIPLVHCDSGCAPERGGWVAVPEEDLPVRLPEMDRYEPTDTGESPLAKMTDWINTSCPLCGGPAQRETDVMPNWAGSSWYFLRYIDPKNNKAFADKKKLAYWMPVDWYNGGMEHTTLHLLYSRFWNKVLYDLGHVPVSEPYAKRTSHGLILGPDGEKMSKSRGNVINPDDIVNEHGADALRVYEMFIGPFDQPVPWSPDGVIGARRFLEKVYGLAEKTESVVSVPEKLVRIVHQTIKKVSEDIEAMKFNTAVSQLMICANELFRAEKIPVALFELYLRTVSAFAPHLAEELWEKLGHKNSIFEEEWPKHDSELAKEEEIELVVQINGKVRDKFRVSVGLSDSELTERALASDKIKALIGNKKIAKTIPVSGKLVNIVLAN